jgi:hypothetical protein
LQHVFSDDDDIAVLGGQILGIRDIHVLWDKGRTDAIIDGVK